jgi:hypothetical protein
MIKDVLADQLYNSVFSVKAMYNDLMVAEYVHVVSPIWKLKVPLKIKVFLGYPKRGIILTKDNLLKRNWKGDGCCCFAALLKPFSIYSLTVMWLNLCGMHYFSLLAFNPQLILHTCWDLGLQVSLQTLENQC